MRRDLRPHRRAGARDDVGADPREPFDDDVDAAADLGHLPDDADGADLPQVRRARVVLVVVLQQQEDQAVGGERAVDRLDRHRPVHRQRLQRQRKRDRAAKRQNRKFGGKRRSGSAIRLGRCRCMATARQCLLAGGPPRTRCASQCISVRRFSCTLRTWTNASSSPRNLSSGRRGCSARAAAAPTTTRSAGCGARRRTRSRRAPTHATARCSTRSRTTSSVWTTTSPARRAGGSSRFLRIARCVPRGARRVAAGGLRRVGRSRITQCTQASARHLHLADVASIRPAGGRSSKRALLQRNRDQQIHGTDHGKHQAVSCVMAEPRTRAETSRRRSGGAPSRRARDVFDRGRTLPVAIRRAGRRDLADVDHGRASDVSQMPATESHATAHAAAPSTCQTTPGTGRHSAADQNAQDWRPRRKTRSFEIRPGTVRATQRPDARPREDAVVRGRRQRKAATIARADPATGCRRCWLAGERNAYVNRK